MNLEKNKVFYAENWLEGSNSGAKNILSIDAAKTRHENGDYYVTIIGNSIDKPSYVIFLDRQDEFFSVHFFDKWNRNYLTHDFHKRSDSEKYYLFKAVWKEYMSLESNELAEGYAYFFKYDSDECYILKEDFVKKERYEKTEHYSQKDKVILFPEFGKYDEILNPNII